MEAEEEEEKGEEDEIVASTKSRWMLSYKVYIYTQYMCYPDTIGSNEANRSEM